MTSISLRIALSNIGEPGSKVHTVPTDFKSTAGNSLKDMAETMMLRPNPEAWTEPPEGHHDEHWTEETQGVTWDGSHFYFSANDAGKPGSHPRAVYRFLGNGDVDTLIEFDEQYGQHLGALDFFDGKLYFAMEQPVGVLVLDATSGTVLRYSPLRGEDGGSPPQSSMPWCAINPWTKFLYSSENGDDSQHEATKVHAYDRNNDYRNVSSADIDLTPHTPRHVQGGCFSPRGHFYLATDQRNPNNADYKLLRAYSAFNGAYLGAAGVLALDHSHDDQKNEFEDCCYAAITLDGIPAQIHAVLLENIYTLDSDNIFFKHFSAPNPGAV
jgi:hypothetical protein